jgi:uncharacterized protein
VDEVRQLFHDHPRYARDVKGGISSWLIDTARHGHVAIAEMLVSMGAAINARSQFGSTALGRAIGSGSIEMVAWLLSHGAAISGPELDDDRLLISAINREPEEFALQLVQLLVEHGAAVNREYTVFGDKNNRFTALEWAAGKPSVAEYLRSKGAVDRPPKESSMTTPKNLSEEIAAYFGERFGAAQPQAQIEIVPTDPPIAIHLIPASDDRKHVTLFTTGMSEQAMTVPEGTDDFRFAELFIQLPGNWPIDKQSLASQKHGWPIHWLRSIAKYPHQHDTWLGGPVTIIANGDPPEPLAPGLKFTSLLVMADQQFTTNDGRTIYLYRLLPLYTEERNLEIQEGVAALMRALDAADISFVVDLARPNVALK